MEEKVLYGLSNVHVAVWDKSAKAYSIPKAVKGAVSLELKPLEDKAEARLDGGYKRTITQRFRGYDGTIEFQVAPLWFYEDVFGDSIDENGIITASFKTISTHFALLAQFESDQGGRRFVFYHCNCFRPGIKQETVSDKIKTNTVQFNIEIRPRISDNQIVSFTSKDTSTDSYNNWFTLVY